MPEKCEYYPDSLWLETSLKQVPKDTKKQITWPHFEIWIENMYWIWKAFPKCCTPFSNTIPSKVHNRLCLSIFLPENPAYSVFKWPHMKGENKTNREWNKSKASH